MQASGWADQLIDVPACFSQGFVLALVPFTPGVLEHVALTEPAKLFRGQGCTDSHDALQAALVVIRVIDVIRHGEKKGGLSLHNVNIRPVRNLACFALFCTEIFISLNEF